MASTDRTALIEMATGFFRGKVLCAAARLRIADALASGPMTDAGLAAAIGADPDGLRRLLRGLASIGVVEEVAPSRFALTAFGQPLRKDAPGSVWASMIFWADLLADAWTYLPDCVRAGNRSGAEEARRRDGTPSRWSREPDPTSIFHAVFAEPSADDFAPYVRAWDFSRARVIADLGGGGGGLLAAILAAHPSVRGILFDRQAAIEGARARFEAPALAGRCQLVAGDLAESVPKGADVYVMRCVLHGCDDEAASKILRNCRSAMSPDSRLLIIEAVLPDRVDRADPQIEKMMMSDLNMLAVTGGRERSEAEWRALVAGAGLKPGKVQAIPGGLHGIVEVAAG
jgi:precorrin-6B methylase 2